MASLTALSKGLISLAVVGAMASAIWHLALKERFSSPASPMAGAPFQPTPVILPAPAAPVSHTVQANNGPSAESNAETGRKMLASGNHPQARVHLEQAVRDGSGAAACLLGEMTLRGQGGIVADQEKSAALFQLAQSRNTICFAPAQ